jgi:hypothetical protein
MAIGYGELKSVNRSSGRSAVAAAAYRAHEKITDERTGEIFDFSPRNKNEKAESFLLFPCGEKIIDRSTLWNLAEASENRCNSTTAREWIGALPKEIDDASQRRISESFALFLTERHGVACDGSIHRNDQENPHLHLLFTTRRFFSGKLQDKTRELDVKGMSSQCVEDMRQHWQILCNQELLKSGFSESIDMRSYARQGINKNGEKKRTWKQSEVVKHAQDAKRLEREAAFLERDADDMERKARRRRDATKPKTPPRRVSKAVGRVGSPWGAGELERALKAPAFVRTEKAKNIPAALRQKFPHMPPAVVFAKAFPEVVAGFPGAVSCGGVGMALQGVKESPTAPQAAGGMLPPPSGLSPEAYAAWLYAYRRALSVQRSADEDKRERARLRL